MSTLAPWLEEVWRQWQTNLAASRFSNATLLSAEKGMGTEPLVSRFAQALMCSNDEQDACGFCHSCQLMQSNSHPDYHYIAPEKSGKSITVDQVRQYNRVAQESSQLSGFRLFVIEPAEAMNESAANALLKTLESPAENCFFLLITTQVNELLPTIKSRCQQWHIANPEPQLLTAWLTSHVSKPIPEYAAHIHGNSPLSTREFVEKGLDAEYKKIEQFFLSFLSGTEDGVNLAKLLASHEDSLLWLWFLLSDAQKRSFSITEPFFTPGSETLACLLSYDTLYKHTTSLGRLREQLAHHTGLNKELLILNWLFEFNGEVCL